MNAAMVVLACVTAVANVMLAIVTWHYVTLTRLIVDEMTTTRNLSQFPFISHEIIWDREASQRPGILVIALANCVKVSNLGNAPATAVATQVTLGNRADSMFGFDDESFFLGSLGLESPSEVVLAKPVFPVLGATSNPILIVESKWQNVFGVQFFTSDTFELNPSARDARGEIIATWNRTKSRTWKA